MDRLTDWQIWRLDWGFILQFYIVLCPLRTPCRLIPGSSSCNKHHEPLLLWRVSPNIRGAVGVMTNIRKGVPALDLTNYRRWKGGGKWGKRTTSVHASLSYFGLGRQGLDLHLWPSWGRNALWSAANSVLTRGLLVTKRFQLRWPVFDTLPEPQYHIFLKQKPSLHFL
jgi:hypothetical protein